MPSNNGNDNKENQGNSSTTSNRDRVLIWVEIGNTCYRGIVTRDANGRITDRTVHNPKPLGQSGLSNSK